MIQFADLLGFLDEVERGLRDMNDLTNAVALNKGFKNELSQEVSNAWWYPWWHDINTNRDLAKKVEAQPVRWCDGLDPEGLVDQKDFFDCILLRKLRTNTDLLLNTIANYKADLTNAWAGRDKSSVETLLIDLSRFAGSMRKNPFSWTIPGTAGQTPNFMVRIAVVIYIVATAEYGNQIHGRIDALAKQLADGGYGYDRRELPLSVYIGDTEPTDFVHLFDLWDAATDRSWLWWTVAAVDGTVKDRINMVKRLFSDHHWSRINTAYASGWGQVRMAFIKDDIGNWSLKNFDNAPEQLLNAYTAVAQTALEKAADLAGNVGSGGSTSTIEALVNLSRNVVMPGPGEASTDAQVPAMEDLHHQTESRRREAGRRAIAEEARQTTADQREKLRRQLVDSISSILQDHGESVELSVIPVVR
jgi:hypothetical protein